MFQTVFPSIIMSSRLYIQQQVYVRYGYLLASGNEMEIHRVPSRSRYSLELLMMKERPSETCRVLNQNK
jgi:hypothetical protein